MKCLLLLTIALFAFVAANEEDTPRKLKPGFSLPRPEIENQCTEETGVSQDQLRLLRLREYTDDQKAHEYVLCSLKQAGLFSEETGFNVDAVVAEFKTRHLEEEKTRELAAKCFDNNEQKSSVADWAYRGVACTNENKIHELLREAERKFNESKNENKA